jgi:hypothetical protein
MSGSYIARIINMNHWPQLKMAYLILLIIASKYSPIDLSRSFYATIIEELASVIVLAFLGFI